MQLFLAIELPEETKKQLFSQLTKIRHEYKDFRWTSENDYYLALQFFGDERKEKEIIEKVDESVFDVHNVHLYSADAGVFIDSKITIYLNFRRSRELERLTDTIKNKLNIQNNKKFAPHLILARYKIPSKQQYFALRKRLANLELDIDFPSSSICLFESIMMSGKLVYKKRAEFPLASDN